MNLVGCFGTYNNILKWLNKPDGKHCVIIGDNGSGKTSLIQEIQKGLASKVNFINFDCSSRLNKKIVIETIDKRLNNKNIIDIMMCEEKPLICVFDEIDGTIECENISYFELSKFLTSKNIPGIFITTKKGISKIQELIKINHLFKLGPYNKKDILRFLVEKYEDIDIGRVKNIIEIHGDDIRKIIDCIENNIESKKDISITYRDSKCILNDIIINDMNDGIRLIESDVMNILFLAHENYHLMSSDLSSYKKVLESLSYVDMFQQSMFENQQWCLNSFSYSSLYKAISGLKPTNKQMKTGTMWSKCSNWQYKKKLYNNFAYTKPNCIFHNMDFVYSLKVYLLNALKNDDIEKCVETLNKLNMDKEGFEQLLRVSDVDGRKSEFKGTLKNKLLKALKST